LPAASLALTEKVWEPSLRLLSALGEVHAVKEASLSSLHSKVRLPAGVTLSVPEKLKLAEAERKRSGFQDMAAEGLITFDELRAKLAALDETRTTAQRELESLSLRHERLAELEHDRDTLLEHYATMVPEALEELTAEERHQVYKMLRLKVYIHPDGDLEIRGVSSEDILYSDGNVSTLTC
jgi:hypothetical protein